MESESNCVYEEQAKKNRLATVGVIAHSVNECRLYFGHLYTLTQYIHEIALSIDPDCS